VAGFSFFQLTDEIVDIELASGIFLFCSVTSFAS